MRLTISAVIGALATLFALVSVPAAASDQPNISITSAGPTGGNPYVLTVVADDGNGEPIGPMTVNILDSTGTTVITTSPMTAVDQSNLSAQEFQSTSPISSSQLPPGTYTMTVDASDATESDTGLPTPSQFSFPYTTNLNVTAAPASISLGSQNVVFTGSVTGTTAVTPSPTGLAGVPVDLSVGGAPASQVAVTDASGNFSYPLDNISASTDYNFTVAATPTYSADAEDVSVPINVLNTAVSVTPTPASVTYGSQSVSFAGTVTGTLTGISAPVDIADAPVLLSIGGGSATQVATTDSNGNFTATVNNISTTTDYNFTVAQTPLYTAGNDDVTVPAVAAATNVAVTPSTTVVTEGTQVVNFTGTVTTQNGTVPVTGAPVDVAIGTGSPTQIGTTDGNGDFTYASGTLSANTNYTFTVAGTSLYSSGSAAVPITVEQATTSMTVTASPNQVGVGSQTVTFTGTVTAAAPVGGTVPVSNAPVVLAGASGQVATTDNNGHFTYTITNAASGDYDFSVASTALYTGASKDVPVGINQAMTNLVVKGSRASVTEGSQSVTFSGTVNGAVPGGPRVQLANVPIDLAVGTGKATQVAVTGNGGTFTYTVTGISHKSDFNFSIGETSNYSAATFDVPVALSPARTRIYGVRVSPAHLKYGQTGRLTGSYEYEHGKAWTGLRGVLVHLKIGTTYTSARTGSGGSFSVKAATTHGSGWSATVEPAALTLGASARGNLTIAVPMRIRSFGASLAASGDVLAGGCLQVTVPYTRGPDTNIELQYSSKASGRPWRDLGSLELQNGSDAAANCRDTSESSFSGSIRAKSDNAYYRVYYAASYSFDSVVSSAVRSARNQTKISSYQIAPRSITSAKELVKITGRLLLKGKSWRAYAGRDIKIYYHDKGTIGAPVALPVVLKTSPGGYFSLELGARAGKYVAVIFAQYAGGRSDLDARSPNIDVTVRYSSKGSTVPAGRSGAAAGRHPELLSPPFLDMLVMTRAAATLTGRLLAKL
jgi:hypothetical protein